MIKWLTVLIACAAMSPVAHAATQSVHETSANYLCETMERMTKVIRESVPLAEKELHLLDERYHDDRYKNLRDCFHLSLSEEPTDVFGNRMPPPLAVFSEHVKIGNANVVTQAVLGVVNQAHKLGSVMLSEALAGSLDKEHLLDLYQKEELESAKLIAFYQEWAFGPM
jgi:hypothetical protein